MPVGKACTMLGLARPPKTKAELRKAFIALAQVHHPDKSTGSNDRMRDLATAYRLLMPLCQDATRPRRPAGVPDSGRAPSSWTSDENETRSKGPAAMRTVWLPWQKERPTAADFMGMGSVDGGGGVVSAAAAAAAASTAGPESSPAEPAGTVWGRPVPAWARPLMRAVASRRAAATTQRTGAFGPRAGPVVSAGAVTAAVRRLWGRACRKVTEAPLKALRSVRFVLTGRPG